LIVVIIFYLVILIVGLWAGWWKKKGRTGDGRGEEDGIGYSEEAILARRDVGLFVGCLTMTGKRLFGFSIFCTVPNESPGPVPSQ